MELDVEAVHEVRGTRGFDRWLAILVGAAALLAAVLATLQADAGKQEERALLMASRLSVQAFQGTAGGMPRLTFQIQGLQDALELGITSTARQIAALQVEDPAIADLEIALAEADLRASDRLFAIASSMGEPPSATVDPVTREVASRAPEELRPLTEDQNHQVNLAAWFGERGARTIFALSLLALGAVLVGLGAVLGATRAGRVALLAATVAIVAAAGWGISSLLVSFRSV
jgi:hypothetical protein